MWVGMYTRCDRGGLERESGDGGLGKEDWDKACVGLMKYNFSIAGIGLLICVLEYNEGDRLIA